MKHRYSKITPILSLVFTLSLCSNAHASTTAYWRFGDGSSFLADSSGNGYTLSTVDGKTAPTQTAIPVSGAGSSFPTSIPQTNASNQYFANFQSATTTAYTTATNLTHLSAFTVEMYTNKVVQSTSNQYLVSEYSSSEGNFRSYALGIGGSTSSGGGAIAANELYVLLSESGTDTNIYASGLTIDAADDYYIAMSFDASNQASGLTFYVQNLTDNGPMQTVSLAHTITDLYESGQSFRVGGYQNNEGFVASSNRLQGIIDEVRLSDTVLAESQLLAIPEPSTTVLLIGVLSLCGTILWRRKSVKE